MDVVVIFGNVPDVVGHGHHVDEVEGKVGEHDRLLLLGNNLYEGPCCGVVGYVANHVGLIALGPEYEVLLVGAGLGYEVEFGVLKILNEISGDHSSTIDYHIKGY